jgi:hypothetical protein
MPSRRLEHAHHQPLRDTRPRTARGPLVILWIFPWMIGASLVLGGYLRHRHVRRILALEQGLVPVRLEAGLTDRTSSVRRAVPSGAERGQRGS